MADFSNPTFLAATSAFMLTAARWLNDHIRRQRDRRSPTSAERRLESIDRKLDASLERTRDLELVTWGIDKQNGLRSDVKELNEWRRDVDKQLAKAAA